MTMKDVNCGFCGKVISKPVKYINEAAKLGQEKFFCNRKCAASKNNAVSGFCKNCGIEVTRVLSEAKKSKTGNIFCSRRCATIVNNTLFRSKENNPNWSGGNYQSICFMHHGKQCIVCDEKLIVAAHHIDENHDNNDPANLAPLCPTHHQYVHSRYAHLVLPKIEEFVRNFLSK